MRAVWVWVRDAARVVVAAGAWKPKATPMAAADATSVPNESFLFGLIGKTRLLGKGAA